MQNDNLKNDNNKKVQINRNSHTKLVKKSVNDSVLNLENQVKQL